MYLDLAIDRYLSLGSSWLTISDHIFIQNIFLFCFYSKWPNIPLWKPIWLKILAQQTTGKILKKSSVWVQTSASSTTSPNKLCQSKSTGWSGHTVHQRFLKFHQHKMTIENNFIINDKIDTYPAFHLIYLLQSLQMLTNTQWQWVYTVPLCSTLRIKVSGMFWAPPPKKKEEEKKRKIKKQFY